ncbi:MAG: methylmalonyl Co-A mutase-associated GTPase MeaB [Deltaproteobacteria bacterium]|nr:MAG: methylmalonyl Co-A mutase-associated GTPase MeaB [Deltaproteobacteria bacterium]
MRRGDRATIGRALSLVESTRPEDRARARALLDAAGPERTDVHRIGVTGPPGVGKSTLIDVLGMRLLDRGHKVAVLAVDPSSERSGGSILGDKTRMTRLGKDPRAFVRPSPSRGALGGVARRTRDAMRLLEGIGYDRIFVETVGVGQSETLVAQLTDTVLGLLSPGVGDGLQGVKRGLLEWVDVVAVTHADGAMRGAAQRTRREFRAALGLFGARDDGWIPPVCAVSAVEGDGVDELCDRIEAHFEHLVGEGRLEARRAEQRVRWMWHLIESGLLAGLRGRPGLAARVAAWERAVGQGEEAPETVAESVVEACLEGLERSVGSDT